MVWASANSCYQLGNLQVERLQLLICAVQIFCHVRVFLEAPAAAAFAREWQLLA